MRATADDVTTTTTTTTTTMGGLLTTKADQSGHGSYKSVVSRYGGRCRWLKDDKFLKVLEGDSVDTEILDEELRLLQEEEPKTCRGKTVKLLESSPLQIAMCVLVLVDAGVVIAEILLDLHAIRCQQREATADLQLAVDFLEEQYLHEVGANFSGSHSGVQLLLQRIRETRKQRNNIDDINNNNLVYSRSRRTQFSGNGNPKTLNRLVTDDVTSKDAEMLQSRSVFTTNVRILERRYVPSRDELENGEDGNTDRHVLTPGELNGNSDVLSVEMNSVDGATSSTDDYYDELSNDVTGRSLYASRLLKIAHALHYGSIAILGVFVVQVFLKIFGLGRKFFHNKLEVFDCAIITASFALDLVFLEGITGAEGEQTIALIIVFLLWRILRVINGIMVTAKQRHEFRIQLQKRACRRAEKKVECLVDDISWKEKEIHSLKCLCQRKGATDDEISVCKPKRSPFFSKMDTSSGLSSIASLSLGFTMSMRAGGLPGYGGGARLTAGGSPALGGPSGPSRAKALPTAWGGPRASCVLPSLEDDVSECSVVDSVVGGPPAGGLVGSLTAAWGATSSGATLVAADDVCSVDLGGRHLFKTARRTSQLKNTGTDSGVVDGEGLELHHESRGVEAGRVDSGVVDCSQSAIESCRSLIVPCVSIVTAPLTTSELVHDNKQQQQQQQQQSASLTVPSTDPTRPHTHTPPIAQSVDSAQLVPDSIAPPVENTCSRDVISAVVESRPTSSAGTEQEMTSENNCGNSLSAGVEDSCCNSRPPPAGIKRNSRCTFLIGDDDVTPRTSPECHHRDFCDVIVSPSRDVGNGDVTTARNADWKYAMPTVAFSPTTSDHSISGALSTSGDDNSTCYGDVKSIEMTHSTGNTNRSTAVSISGCVAAAEHRPNGDSLLRESSSSMKSFWRSNPLLRILRRNNDTDATYL